MPDDPTLRSLIRRLQDGDAAAAGELRALARAHPRAVVEATMGDLSELVVHRFMAGQLATSPATAEGVRAKLGLLRAELAGESPSPARRLVAEAVAFAW